MTHWITDWLRAFTWTIVVELLIAMPLLRVIEARAVRRGVAIVFANLATHPAVWFIFPGAALSFATRITLSELFAWVVEVFAYRLIWPELSWRRAFAVSLCANAASALSGMLMPRG